ncbi:MAG: leucyl aminopeptidase family protein [Rhodospirillales bacterium]|nr:leucyl aminopeptidase family protein [Rhodospirillales bacterium]
MSEKSKSTAAPTPQDILLAADTKRKTLPVWLVRDGKMAEDLAGLPAEQRQWLEAVSYKAAARQHVLVPGAGGGMAGAVLGIGKADEPRRSYPPETLLGLMPAVLPGGAWHLGAGCANAELAAVAWGLGAYRFRRYKSGEDEPVAALKVPKGVDLERVTNTVEAVWLGRDLINTPANDMGPEELEAAARALAKRHGAKVTSIVGDDLLKKNFPLIHAVGRASPRAPRLIDVTWARMGGRADAPKVTIVGKGICFDTGGLDIKPSSGMLLMKKDMGGAATALALAHMVMGQKLDVRLRVLIAAAENSVAGSAFRPGDVIPSRLGKSVEIGNTDAEGRLVLADALALADEETPDYLMTFATLTGAARVALGPELMPFYCNDDALAGTIAAAGASVGDLVWRMPLATPYESWLDSQVADMNNVAEGGFAGSIIGAIFLQRFVSRARHFAHFDIYGWRPAAGPLGPKGGEPNAARGVLEALCRVLRAGH